MFLNNPLFEYLLRDGASVIGVHVVGPTEPTKARHHHRHAGAAPPRRRLRARGADEGQVGDLCLAVRPLVPRGQPCVRGEPASKCTGKEEAVAIGGGQGSDSRHGQGPQPVWPWR